MLFPLDKGNDAFGFLAAFVGSLCYGSYGVPIKATQSIEVHPLVLQSYKSLVVLVASLSVVRLFEEPSWTPYGLLAGLLEVVGGTAGIVAIRKAGIATAIGTWASVMIVVNFVWGILIFHEPVRSMSSTCGAFTMLGMGLIGMTKFSSPNNSGNEIKDEMEVIRLMKSPGKEDTSQKDEEFDRETGNNMSVKRLIPRKRVEEYEDGDNSSENGDTRIDEYPELTGASITSNDKGERIKWRIQHLRTNLTDREFGIACAMFNGILGASAMVPLHYTKNQGFSEFSYIFSFVIGACIANLLLWAVHFIFHCCCHSNNPFRLEVIKNAYKAMPHWHMQELWFKLLVAGLLLTMGMFGSVLAISSLGQAVGNSLIQSKMLVSGLWGICCFQEIKDQRAITSWFLSATLSVVGILWLSFERQAVTSLEDIL
ncbi:drug/metabolite transporter superfamily protein [Nitzschia inconspicua]|uniref:Drug/metabolite transporter superfamily protein n=1 Tax=Nitzschia inconspicua TaxID=303405 RepID=A0A9K3PYV6_9STRA|nr:drug/metabolite transporter superfamily protein [Nitzschia inconspicua]